MSERVEEYGVLFATGVPVRFRFMRNTEHTPRLPRHIQPEFGQDIEPAGRYMLHAAPSFKPVGPWIAGEILFTRPLVMEHVNTSSDAHGWKRRLSKAFGGKKGKALSKAIVRAGYDGIVTVDNGRTSEIVDLTELMRETFRPNPRERIEGGLGDGRPDSDFDPVQLRKGIEVEYEHTSDYDVAREIAKDHLTEHPDYYVELAKAEARMARRNPIESESTFKPHSLERGEDPRHRDEKPPTDAKKRYETSHWGVGATKVYKAHIPGEPTDLELTEMGKLIELWVRFGPRGRMDDLKITFPKHSKCILAFTTDERERLYLVLPKAWRDFAHARLVQDGYEWYPMQEVANAAGGRQAKYRLPFREVQVLGRLTNVVYSTWKKGDNDAEGGCEYIHRMGEDGGIEPYLAVDDDGYLWVCGGTYSVPDDGITQ